MSKMGLIFRPTQIRKAVHVAFEDVEKCYKGGKKGSQLYDCPCTFDIETTSFYQKGNKRACMYIWQMCLNGLVVVGRTWDEFDDVCTAISEALELDPEKLRLIVYVRNLPFEFQFIMKRFDFTKVFAVNNRKPVQAITSIGIEFRCSYILTGYSLAMSGKLLNHYSVRKMVGDLDYNMIRHSGTKMTDTEIGYCVNDVLVDACCIKEKIEEKGSIKNVPLTKTGYVREYMRNCCLYDDSGNHQVNTDKYHAYKWLMSSLVLTEDTYLLGKRCFAGGFTHTSAWRENRVLYDVGTKDETSAYPYQIVESDKMPMSAPEYYEVQSGEDFRHQLECYACMFDIKIWGLKASTTIDHTISFSKCWDHHRVVLDNGRVVKADYVLTSMTEQDFEIFEMYYTYDRIAVGNFHRMYRGRLPRDFVAGLLDLYEKKTKLKGVKGRETEYQRAKEDANSTYGMLVQDDISRAEMVFEDGEWLEPVEPDIEKNIEKYNRSPKRFTYFLWGVWVTALNRNRVLKMIRKIGDDYCYTDTDSIKYLHREKYEKLFERENEITMQRLHTAMQEQGIPFDKCCPKTIEGIEKPLGVWDDEHPYERAKFLRAKTYMTETDGELSITVSGLNKHVTVPWMLQTFKDNTGCFDAFTNDLIVPPEHTGKLTHTYIDEETGGTLVDYMGVKGTYHEMSSVHLEPGEYHLNLDDEFIKYIQGLEPDT